MLKEFIEDAMSQIFLVSNGYYNPTRIVILFSIIDIGACDNKIKKEDVVEYIYRYYIVNSEIAKHNPNLSIRVIPKYGINDFLEILDQELTDWDSNSKNHILKYDSNYIYINFDIDELAKNNIKIIGNMLMEKYFNKKFEYPFSLDDDEIKADEQLLPFGKSNYFYVALEDMQYCPLCENTLIDDLYVVHILPSKYCSTEGMSDKNNSIILCKNHAEDYVNKKFYFNARGFVQNISSEIVNEKMHLEIGIRRKKQEYINKYVDIIEKK